MAGGVLWPFMGGLLGGSVCTAGVSTRGGGDREACGGGPDGLVRYAQGRYLTPSGPCKRIHAEAMRRRPTWVGYGAGGGWLTYRPLPVQQHVLGQVDGHLLALDLDAEHVGAAHRVARHAGQGPGLGVERATGKEGCVSRPRKRCGIVRILLDRPRSPP